MKFVVASTCAVSACVESVLGISQGGVWLVEFVVACPNDVVDVDVPDDVEEFEFAAADCDAAEADEFSAE